MSLNKTLQRTGDLACVPVLSRPFIHQFIQWPINHDSGQTNTNFIRSRGHIITRELREAVASLFIFLLRGTFNSVIYSESITVQNDAVKYCRILWWYFATLGHFSVLICGPYRWLLCTGRIAWLCREHGTVDMSQLRFAINAENIPYCFYLISYSTCNLNRM